MNNVFDNPWLRGLFSDSEADQLWAPETLIGHYMAFEIALTQALEEAGLVPRDHGAAAVQAMEAVQIDFDRLQRGTERDGLPIPDFVRQLKEAAGEFADAVHTGATSQDVMDTSLALSMGALIDIILTRCETLVEMLRHLHENHGASVLMGRTRMQAALPITVGERINAWRAPLKDHVEQFNLIRPRVARLQLGGPVGTRFAFGASADQIAEHMAEQLGLAVSPHVWHTDRSAIGLLAGHMSNLTGSLGKIGQDIALMSQQGVDEIKLAAGGGSSAMPHKSNPVLAELLVTLARFNAAQLTAVHQSLIHEQERSGAAWMLEWMVLPSMAMATCRSLSATQALLDKIDAMGNPA